MIRWLFIAALAIGLLAARQAQADDAAKPIRELLETQVKAWNKGDLKGFMDGYWNSPELTFYSGRDIRQGWQETFDRYRDRYQKGGAEMGHLTFSDLSIEPLADKTMFVRGRWKLELKKGNLDGLFTLIVKEKPEGWRIVHDHTSVGEPDKKP
jgi:beta-aspartyl-peptidase (threonine type)